MRKANKMVKSTEEKVVIKKHSYFFPEIGKTIVAENIEEATKIARQK